MSIIQLQTEVPNALMNSSQALHDQIWEYLTYLRSVQEMRCQNYPLQPRSSRMATAMLYWLVKDHQKETPQRTSQLP